MGQTGGGFPLRASAKEGAWGLSLREDGDASLGPSSVPPVWDDWPGTNSLATGLSCDGEGVGSGGEEVSWGRRSWILSGLSSW